MSEDSPRCYFHPREVMVGVCPLCLKERLLVLASKQQRRLSEPTCAHQRAFSRVTSTSRFMSIAIPKVFALGSFLHWRKSTHKDPHEDYISSLEESFISIKFGVDGRASWDKKHPKEPFYLCNNEKAAVEASKGQSQSVVGHAKPRGTLRWRTRIGHLLQVIRRRRRSTKAGFGSGRVRGRGGGGEQEERVDKELDKEEDHIVDKEEDHMVVA